MSKMYVVSVDREGVRRTCTLVKAEAQQTALDAISQGLPVTCRPMEYGEPLILGVRSEPLLQTAADVK